MKEKIILLLILAIIPIKINAECSTTELSRLKTLANNINLSYEYDEANPSNFRVVINNIVPEIYVTDQYNIDYYTYQNANNGEVITNNYIGATNIKFNIYSNNVNCQSELLTTKTITLPLYNSYYYDNVCIGLEDYELCQKWNSYTGTFEEFQTTVNKYKESLNKKQEDKQQTNSISRNNFILDFYLKYYYIILPIIIVLSSAYIYFKNKKDKLI